MDIRNCIEQGTHKLTSTAVCIVCLADKVVHKDSVYRLASFSIKVHVQPFDPLSWVHTSNVWVVQKCSMS